MKPMEHSLASLVSLDPDVEVVKEEHNEGALLVYVGKLDRYMKLRPPASELISVLERSGPQTISVGAPVVALAKLGLVSVPGVQVEKPGRFKRYRLSGYTLRIPLVRRFGYLGIFQRQFKALFTQISRGRVYAVWLLALAVNGLAFEWPESRWYDFVITATALFLHELGHVFAAVGFGVKPRSAGLALHGPIPVAYVDYTDAYRIESKNEETVLLAGPAVDVFNLTILSAFALAGFQSVAFFSVVLIAMFNMNPIVSSDLKRAFSARQVSIRERFLWSVAWVGTGAFWLWGSTV